LTHPLKAAPLAAWRSIGFVAVAIALTYCVVHAFDPPRLNWGDSASDYNVMTAGRNFANYGFIKLHFTPFLIDPALMRRGDRAMIYTHYPQLPDLMNGFLRTAFGMSDIVQFRFVSLAFSFAALFFIYRLAVRYWSRRTAQLALTLWVANPLWLQHADYLHQSPYASFFGFGSVYFLSRYLLDERATGYLTTSGVFLLFTFLSSYDYWIFGPLLITLVIYERYRSLRRAPAVRLLATLAAFAIIALALKIGSNIWVLGGLKPFVADLRFQFIERATNQVVRTSFTSGIWPTLIGRIQRCFSMLLFPTATFWMIWPAIRRRGASRAPRPELANDRGPANPLVLLLAALPFLLMFNEIWVGQYYPTLLIVPFYAIASAALAVLLLEVPSGASRLAGAALFLALLGHSLNEDFRFKKAFVERETIRTLGAQLDTVSVPGQTLLTNHVFDTFYRYYFNRRTVPSILVPVQLMDTSLAYYATSSGSGTVTSDGTIFVEHKHLEAQLFDKAYYYLFAAEKRWNWWGNPTRFRSDIDRFVANRDSELVRRVAHMGRKLYETDAYVIWRYKP
jgi:hypothetical protein